MIRRSDTEMVNTVNRRTRTCVQCNQPHMHTWLQQQTHTPVKLTLITNRWPQSKELQKSLLMTQIRVQFSSKVVRRSFPSVMPSIGVIYRWYEGVPVPPLFKTKRWRICSYLLSTEAICGYYITIKTFSAGTTLVELRTLPRPQSWMKPWLFLPILLGTPGRLILPLGIPHF